MINKTALITGVLGQDGSYLAELLLTKGYQVVGTSHSRTDASLPPHLAAGVKLESLDLGSAAEVKSIIDHVRPIEVYNLAARSSSAQLFDDPLATADINGLATVRFLEAIREVSPQTRFCQAASSEIFVGCDSSPQSENTPFRPVNAYGAAKTYATNMVTAYRARYGLFASTAILFNHESPRRGINYVTRKITHTVAKIALGQANELVLGNLDNRRDWGFAGDYTRAMWLMMQDSIPDDFIVATGVTHSVREFCEIAFSHVNLNYRDFVRINPQLSGRKESIELCGRLEKIKYRLGWQPSVSFFELVQMMVDADLAQLKSNLNQLL